jgi:hypothetical protein
MAWYDLKTYRRAAGTRGRMIDAAIIEAADDDHAIAEAHRRTRELPADCFALLFDEQEGQVALFGVATPPHA